MKKSLPMRAIVAPSSPLHKPVGRLICAVVLGSMLAGMSACSLLLPAEPIDTYLLPSENAPKSASAARASPLALRINKPVSGLRLAGQRIVVLPEADRVSVYKGAQWSDPLPVLVRNRLIDAFRADGRIAHLSSDDKLVLVDMELDADLRAFQVEYPHGSPEVYIALDARLIDPGLKRVVASRRFEIRQPVQGKEVPQVVGAFGTASDALSAQLVDWVVGHATAGKWNPYGG